MDFARADMTSPTRKCLRLNSEPRSAQAGLSDCTPCTLE